jgi:hypothetical protein
MLLKLNFSPINVSAKNGCYEKPRKPFNTALF